MRFLRLAPALLLPLVCVQIPLRSQPQTGRALVIEDYYRVQSVGNPTISPDAKWVTYTVSSRVEEDNSTETGTWVVAADGSRPPYRVQHYGRDVSGARWTDDNRLEYVAERRQWSIDPATPSAAPRENVRAASVAAPGGGRGGRGGRGGGGGGAGAPGTPSPDGKWIARTVNADQPRPEPSTATDFERRHEERFKGVTFDWKDFQRDGQPFPAPDPTAGPAQRIEVQPAGGGERRVLVDKDLRPTDLAWHPSGQTIAFTADAGWRNDLKYNRADLWTVTLDGQLTRLTDDGYVHSDVDYSPDGKYLSVRAIVRHRHDHREEAESWRAARHLHPARRRRRACEPDGELGSRPWRDTLVAGQPVHVLQRGDRRRESSVPRVGAGRKSRTDDQGSAPGERHHVR